MRRDEITQDEMRKDRRKWDETRIGEIEWDAIQSDTRYAGID